MIAYDFFGGVILAGHYINSTPMRYTKLMKLFSWNVNGILSLIRCCYIARLNFTRGGVGLKYQLQRFLDGYLDQDVDQFAYQTK